jgi:hypothetical protein
MKWRPPALAAVTHLFRTTLLALSLLAATAALVPAASAGVDICDNPGLCVRREGACASVVWYVAMDFAAGAGSCPDVTVNSDAVYACEFAWAGTGGLGGFQGVIVDVCAGQDASGNVCVVPYAQVFDAVTNLDPLCLA